jgi:hypothetical protein
MYINSQNQLYFGDLAQGDRAATPAEIAAWELSRQPTYQQLRAAEYSLKSTGEQFAMMYDDAVKGTTTWLDWQAEIKTRIAK